MLRQPGMWGQWASPMHVPFGHAPAYTGPTLIRSCQMICHPHPLEKSFSHARPDHERRMAFALLALEASTERRTATVHGTGMANRPRLNSDPAPCNKWHGVNYGNRFIPEDWMRHPYNFFQHVRRSARRVALWDLKGPEAKQRMMSWLDATISEGHFAEMKSMGVEVIRVPCGYWNWVTYAYDDGPEVSGVYATGPIREQLKNLHRIASPQEYRRYFDKIFDFSERYGIKVLLDLHALPGSQNGEIHSGVCIESKDEHLGFFQCQANLQMAVEAVREMARYGRSKSNLCGIQVMSEPHLHTDEGHAFLESYYQQAILAARDFLDPSVPIVLFEWTYEMSKWDENAFPEAMYGKVCWDTHLYHFPTSGQTWTSQNNGLEQAKQAYSWDLQQLRHFSQAQGRDRVFVCEFSLAGPNLNLPETREFAEWLVEQMDFACSGSMLWSYDNRITAWSLQRQCREWGLDWKRLWASRDGARAGASIGIRAASFGTWLTANDQGTVEADAPEHSWWEEWVPYRYSVEGKAKIALRSAAFGTWLSVTCEGEVTQSEHRSAWEEFSVLYHADHDGHQCISLQSFHGSWLSVRRFNGPQHRLLLSTAYSIHDTEVNTAWLIS